MQTFMHADFEEHLNKDTRKLLVSEYEDKGDSQSIYCEIKKHAKSSAEAQISADSLLKYITSSRDPATWHGNSYAFVLHWKEQVTQCEKLELEDIPPKQKLRMLQNTLTAISDLADVKQLIDQMVARGDPPLTFEGYIELLLSACSIYDKSITTTLQSGQWNVYAATMEYDEKVCYDSEIRRSFMQTRIFRRLLPTQLLPHPLEVTLLSYHERNGLSYPPNNIQNCWPSNARNVQSRKALTSLATFLFSVLTFMLLRRWLIYMISLSIRQTFM
jgi:hypothetical protein